MLCVNQWNVKCWAKEVSYTSWNFLIVSLAVSWYHFSLSMCEAQMCKPFVNTHHHQTSFLTNIILWPLAQLQAFISLFFNIFAIEYKFPHLNHMSCFKLFVSKIQDICHIMVVNFIEKPKWNQFPFIVDYGIKMCFSH